MQLLGLTVLSALASSVMAMPVVDLQGVKNFLAGGPPKCYRGTEFPGPNEWESFDSLWNQNKGTMLKVSQPVENNDIRRAIEEVSREAGFDNRVILATMMQESTGNPKAAGAGLLQVNGGSNCRDVPGPCPFDRIKKMISEGVNGNGVGNGLKPCYNQNGNSYGKALRCYNSGSVVDPNDLTKISAGIVSYVSDVANRLRGAAPATNCGF